MRIEKISSRDYWTAHEDTGDIQQRLGPDVSPSEVQSQTGCLGSDVGEVGVGELWGSSNGCSDCLHLVRADYIE